MLDLLINHLQHTGPLTGLLLLCIPVALIWHWQLWANKVHRGPLLALPGVGMLLLTALAARADFLLVIEALRCHGETPNVMRAGGWSFAYRSVTIGLGTATLAFALAAPGARGRTRLALVSLALAGVMATAAASQESQLWWAIRHLDEPLPEVLAIAPGVHLLGAAAATLTALGLALLATDPPNSRTRSWSLGITLAAAVVMGMATSLAAFEGPAGQGPERLDLGPHWEAEAPIAELSPGFDRLHTRHPALLPGAPRRVHRAMDRAISIEHTRDLGSIVAWYVEHQLPFDRLVVEPDPSWTVGDLEEPCVPPTMVEGLSHCLVVWPAEVDGSGVFDPP